MPQLNGQMQLRVWKFPFGFLNKASRHKGVWWCTVRTGTQATIAITCHENPGKYIDVDQIEKAEGGEVQRSRYQRFVFPVSEVRSAPFHDGTAW